MSTQSTLDALKYYLQLAVPAVNVQTDFDTIPFSGRLPALIVTEMEGYIERVYAGVGARGNTDGRPNMYSLVYLQAPVGTQGTDLAAVFKKLRADVEAITDQFSAKVAQNLAIGGVDQAIAAAEYMNWQYDRVGPMITYLGQQYVGAFGLISVKELLRVDR